MHFPLVEIFSLGYSLSGYLTVLLHMRVPAPGTTGAQDLRSKSGTVFSDLGGRVSQN